MKIIILLYSLTLLLTSCASKKNMRAIPQESLDGLKYETLARYDKQRLKQVMNKENPLALCHEHEFDKAQKLLKEKLDEKINDFDYWNKISTCYIIQKDYSKAKYFLDIALSRTQKNNEKAIVLNNIGLVLLEQQHFEEAKEYFKKSIELSKNYLTPKYNLVQIYLKFGIYKKANTEIDKLLKTNNRDIDFLNSKAHVQLMLKEYKNALVYFNKIPKSYWQRDDIATNAAMTYFMLGLYTNAKDVLSSADKKNEYFVKKQELIEENIELKLEKKVQ